MKRSLCKPATAISIALAASTPAVDSFFVPPSAKGASRIFFPPKTKILPNPNSRIQHLSDHMPCCPQTVEGALYVTPMQGDDLPNDLSRREMMDIALGAMTGWTLGPRVTFAASLSDPAITDEDNEALTRPWDEKYKLFVEHYRENGNEYARIAEKHKDDAADLTTDSVGGQI